MFAVLQSRLYGLLRWSERYTKLDMVYLASGSFWTTLGQGVSNVLSLGLLIAFANLLPPETYGLYRYILSLAGLLGILSLKGMNSAVSRAVAMGQEGALRHSVRFQFRWNLILSAGFLAFSGYYFLRGDELFAFSFLILGAFVPATQALNTFGAYLEGKREFRIASMATIGSSTLYTLGMLAVLWWKGEILWLIFAYAGTTFVATAFFYFYTIRKFSPPLEEAPDALRYGKQLTLISFISPIAAQIDKILVAKFWGTAELALYAIVTAVVDRINTVVKGWVQLGYPKLAEKSVAEINRIFFRRVLQGILGGAAIATGYVLVSPYLFAYLLPQYLSAVSYSNLLILSIIFNIPGKYANTVLHSQKMVRTIFSLTLASTLLQIALYVAMGLMGGIEGLILAYIINSALALLMQVLSWRRYVRSVSLS